ncbi:hypothetical protein HMI54_005102 [Coelomomyces lativittatus]|nr:hypothetical protein HMI54_005102 [Coelomomyces lativittatus]
MSEESVLLEIDQFMVTHFSQSHSVRFLFHVVTADSPSTFIQEENLFLRKKTTNLRSFPDFEPVTFHSKHLLKIGAPLLRQRLKAVENQLSDVTKTHQKEI